jgi:hypothetical protein
MVTVRFVALIHDLVIVHRGVVLFVNALGLCFSAESL